ncbi:Adaptive-response sensory-kinase SasA [bioreactor metagenome]|uniref:histidine kinase n=1 Tax=bioreactor metagenome TaxID=1076179 RepID=A0A645AK84_9ZZZZ
MIVAAAIVFLLMGVGMLKDLSELSLLKSFILLAVISTIMGTILTTVIGNEILNPFRVLNVAMKKLASGDFSVRIELSNHFAAYEFDELTASFNLMAEQLGSVEMLRSDFVNNFSHEFKTPIVSVKGFAKVLKKDELSLAERNEYLDIIINEADRLATLSRNVLSLSKIENQTIITDNNWYDLTEQLRCAILLLENKWQLKHLDLDINLEEIKFFGNEELLNQIWINLIDNAIKFSNDSGQLSIRLMRNQDDIVFEIRDTGIGMSPETQKFMFDKFYQGDTSHSVEGNGIGMTIVRKIVELYKGEIFIDSTLNQGTSIIITLPNQKHR